MPVGAIKTGAISPMNNITESDIVAWLDAQAERYELPKWASISVGGHWESYGGAVGGSVSVSGVPPEPGKIVFASGETVEQAVAKFAAEIPPTGLALASKLRRDAYELVAKAAKIEADAKEAA